jgi:hypothetical protein
MNKIENIIKLKSINKHEKLSRILKYIFVDICKMDQKKYYILGSYALRNERKINDLDINVDKDEFMKLENATKNGFGRLEFLNNQIRWFFDLTKIYNKLTKSREKDFSIEAFMKDKKIGYPNNNFSLSKLIKNKGLDRDKNKHQFLNLKFLLKWKKTMNREKDKADIELIKKLLK